jgi:hypothetical protein
MMRIPLAQYRDPREYNADSIHGYSFGLRVCSKYREFSGKMPLK